MSRRFEDAVRPWHQLGPRANAGETRGPLDAQFWVKNYFIRPERMAQNRRGVDFILDRTVKHNGVGVLVFDEIDGGSLDRAAPQTTINLSQGAAAPRYG